uniref:Urease accessory protein UreH-like transmembrane domain-containing protein n=1 Tax=candidate division WOR-3 bacterium TaxID=2052148 RepID=A0A7V6CMX4_UNCW3
MASLLFKAVLLGLATGYFCFGYCLPTILPYFLSTDNLKKGIKHIFFFLFGRLFGYLAFGLLFALLGKSLVQISTFHKLIMPFLYLSLSILLFFYGFFLTFPHFSFCQIFKNKLSTNLSLFFVGLIVGINICPPFLISILNVIETADILKGLLYFFFFFLATTIYFFPLVFFSFLTRYRLTQIIGKISAFLAGSYFLYQGILTFIYR